MKSIFLLLWMVLLFQPVLPAHSEESQTETNVVRISEEDLEIIKVLEILKMMALMENYDIVKDMEILTEENADENKK
ncbi:MAG: hypothetical protein C4522_11060 [Desulfobacteraceae bacterium]|nr:MAG: hypothetical protein C4522_11060 [Desulfobacteraceae bacterium]